MDVDVKDQPRKKAPKVGEVQFVPIFDYHGETFICTQCGYYEHADIGAAKTIRDRVLELIEYQKVHGDSMKPEPKNSKRPKKHKETSARSTKSKRVEPGNPKSKGENSETGIQEDIA